MCRLVLRGGCFGNHAAVVIRSSQRICVSMTPIDHTFGARLMLGG